MSGNQRDSESWAELFRLREEVKGPEGFATWKDAAVAERVKLTELKEKLAEVMPLAKFGALIATNGTMNLSNDAYKSGVFKDPNFLCKHDNIEATITKLLND